MSRGESLMTGAPDPFHSHDHHGCTDAVLAGADRMASDRQLRLTPVRRRTLEILLESHRAMGAYDVLDRLAAEGFGRQPPVVYRALEFLVEHGLAHRIQILNAFAACMHPETAHQPVFLICTGCHRIAEAPATALRTALDAAAGDLGFRVERTSFEATGQCPACRGAACD
jgi:Fur family transcriptional regulator, zinc uptake regulator